MKKNILVILGMHRSGTSLITQWLYRCGLPIGDALLGPKIGNVEGHFEDLDFVNLHTELLVEDKLPGSGLTAKPVKDLNPWQALRIKNLVESKNSQHKQWGWKDPRTCLFLPAYRNILPSANYLIILRGYQCSVSSLVNRKYKVMQQYYQTLSPLAKFFSGMKKKFNKEWLYKTCTEEYLKIWIAYNTALLQHIEALPRKRYIVVEYTDLIQDDKPVYSHLADEWGFELEYCDFKDVYKQELISKSADISPYIEDKSLLEIAENIELRLKSTATMLTFAHS